MKIKKRISDYLEYKKYADNWKEKHPAVKLPEPDLKKTVLNPIAKVLSKTLNVAFKQYKKTGAGYFTLEFGKKSQRILVDLEVNTENLLIYLLDKEEKQRYKPGTIGAISGLNRRRITFHSHYDEKTIADYILKNKERFIA